MRKAQDPGLTKKAENVVEEDKGSSTKLQLGHESRVKALSIACAYRTR